MFRKKQTCVGCHFFIKIHHLDNLRSIDLVSERERQKALENDFTWVKDFSSLECSYGVWTEGYNFDKGDRFKHIVEKSRRDFCFFFKYKAGMLVPAAKLLFEREDEAKKASKDRQLTIIGLWVASIALLINAYLVVAENHNWLPF